MHHRIDKLNQQLDSLLCQACLNQFNPQALNIHIQSLIDKGADVNLQGNWLDKKNTLLLFAISTHNQGLCQYLLNKKADVNCSNANGITPLLLAISKYDTLIPKLLKCGAKIDTCDKQGITPLMRAAKYGKHRLVSYLLSKGAKISLTDKHRQSVLFYTGSNAQITKTLLEKGANPAQESLSGKNPLFLAQDVQVVEMLLEYGADVNKQDLEKRTPLMTMANNPKLAKVLLKYGADPKMRDSVQDTALHFAQNPQSIQLLLQAGADIDAQGYGQETPLLRLAKNPYVTLKTIQTLLRYHPLPLQPISDKGFGKSNTKDTALSTDTLSIWSYIRDPKIKKVLLNYQEKYGKKKKHTNKRLTSYRTRLYFKTI